MLLLPKTNMTYDVHDFICLLNFFFIGIYSIEGWTWIQRHEITREWRRGKDEIQLQCTLAIGELDSCVVSPKCLKGILQGNTITEPLDPLITNSKFIVIH